MCMFLLAQEVGGHQFGLGTDLKLCWLKFVFNSLE